MIKVQKLSYGVPAKELYKDISFTLEPGQHCVLIGSNGTGKSTLADILMDPDEYLFDGRVIKDPDCRTGYASQFCARDKDRDRTVFEYLSERFIRNEQDIADICEAMAVEEDLEPLLERYQELLDLQDAMGGDDYESRIHKQLYTAGMTEIRDTMLSQISGGEYKVLQIMREMLLSPNLLILDEPDVFLDFANLNSLCRLINGFEGIMLVITHNRYLLNHCFNKILHLENGELNEFEGTYTEYRCWQLREKLKLRKQNLEEEEEIERTQEMVNILRKRATDMVNPVIGQSVNAKQTQLDRLRARHIGSPFIEMREPQIRLPLIPAERTGDPAPGDEALAGEKPPAVLSIKDYQVTYDQSLLENVDLEVLAGEKVAIVGANGTGKTTLVRDIMKNDHPAISIAPGTKTACLSQLDADADDGTTILQMLQDTGMYDPDSIKAYLRRYCLGDIDIRQDAGCLSGGEQNLLQLAVMENSGADLLILDEPSSHLDIYAQTALEKAIDAYEGTILMVSHDFYLIANCADHIMFIENNTIRRMRGRTFRKMVYDRYFDQKYLEVDRKRQEIENDITRAYRKNDLAAVEKLCDQLEALSTL